MRDRDLVRLYWPAELRPAFDALFAIDDAMADVVAQSTQPALGAVKLAWWRERLGELDEGKVPAEPRLQVAAAELLPRGVSGRRLSALEHGWAALLEEDPNPDRALARGATLFRLAAELLGAEATENLMLAGRTYAAANLARRGLLRPREHAPEELPTFPRKARPLTGLTALAVRDLSARGPWKPEATPGRAWLLLRHRMTGGFPR